jgi:tetratricopeptide (TPR) repeat protein
MTLPVLLTIVGTVATVSGTIVAILQLRRTPAVPRKGRGRHPGKPVGPSVGDDVTAGTDHDSAAETPIVPRRGDECGNEGAADVCQIVGTPVSYGLETFKDREAELQQIVGWLADSGIRLITVSGRRGIGKSALAAKIVEILAHSGIVCQGVANLSTRTGGALTVERLFFTCAELAATSEKAALEALWASAREPRDKLIGLFAAMGQGAHLVILDNIEDELDDEGQPTNPDLEIFLDVVFRASHAPKVLVTTQIPVLLDPAVRRFEAQLDLQYGLPVDDCIELLRELDRNGDAGVRDASRAQLEHAATSVNCVPRALELVVGALVDDDLTFPTLDEVLRDFPAREDIVDKLAHRRYQRLDGEARLTLDVLAVFRDPVGREPIEWVTHLLRASFDPARALRYLVHVHMVSVDRHSRRFGLHPLDAQIAYAALPNQGSMCRQDLERSVAAWYAENCSPPPWRAVVDVANHRRVFEHLLRAEEYDKCAFILDEIGEFLIWRGSSREVLSMHLEIRSHLHDEAALLAHLVGYGFARDRSGPMEEAIEPLQQAIALAERIADPHKLERALFCLGEVYRDLRRLDEAVEVLTKAASLAGEIGDRVQQGHSLLQLSLAFTYLGNVSAALEVADELEQLADADCEAQILAQVNNARSAAYVVAERWTEAAITAKQAVRGYEIYAIPEIVGYARNTQGIALLAVQHIDEAISVLNLALADGANVQSPRNEGLCFYNLAWAHWKAGRFGTARHNAQAAVEAFRRSGGPDLAAGEGLVSAITAMIEEDRDSAISALNKAARASQDNSDLVPAKWLEEEADRLSGH